MSANSIKQDIKAHLFDVLLEQSPYACFVCEIQLNKLTQQRSYPIVAMNKAMRQNFIELEFTPLNFDAPQLFSSIFSLSFEKWLSGNIENSVLPYNGSLFEVKKIAEQDQLIVVSIKQSMLLAESNDIARLFIDNTDNVYLLIDNKTIKYVNTSFIKLWGRSLDDAHYDIESIKRWIHPNDKEAAFAWLQKSQWKYEEEYFRIILPGDAIKWIWNKVHYDASTNRIIAIMTDVTRQKQIEEELTLARNKAQESDRLKTAFLANISHEIRTPMNGIIGFSNLLAEEEFTSIEERRSYANIIVNSSEQLLNIIDDIIDVAKIESNQLRVTPTKVLVNGVLDQMLAFFEVEKKRKDKSHISIELRKGLLDSQSLIISDEFRLRQILINLLNNALKFTKEGKITFGYDIAFENASPYLQFFVIDSGMGIDPDNKALVFNHFYQVEQTGKHTHQSGTGLGLAICSGLVRLLGGRIWVESELQKGASFNFTIPYITPALTALNDGPTMPLIDVNLSGKTFLVVEDDTINFEVITRLLGNTKVQINHAPSGNEALQMINDKDFDLILLDIRLPDINGYDICKQIRRTNSKLPVIAQTANAYPEDRARCFEVGFSDYLAKPLSRSSLLAAISKQIS